MMIKDTMLIIIKGKHVSLKILSVFSNEFSLETTYPLRLTTTTSSNMCDSFKAIEDLIHGLAISRMVILNQISAHLDVLVIHLGSIKTTQPDFPTIIQIGINTKSNVTIGQFRLEFSLQSNDTIISSNNKIFTYITLKNGIQ